MTVAEGWPGLPQPCTLVNYMCCPDLHSNMNMNAYMYSTHCMRAST
jgi:hypothetical protein